MSALVPVLLATLASAPAAQAADCAEPVSARAFAQLVSTGDTAYANLDEQGFREARFAAAAALPCLSEGITSGQAAAWHRLEALAAFLDRDHAGAVASFKSLLAAAPGYELPESMAPPAHPLRTYFAIAQGSPETFGRPLEKPKAGWIHLDGSAAKELPVDRPAIYQRFADTGALQETLVVRPGIETPGLTSERSTAQARRPKRTINVGLASAAGIAALASGGLYLAANSRSQQFWDPTTPDGELTALRQQTNTFGWMSAGFGAVALGTGTAALLVGTW